MQHKIKELLKNNKGVFLALDHGLEHGPKDFNQRTIDAEYVFNIAKEGKYNALILQKGLAMKYYDSYRYKIPLILKLNGKTTMPKGLQPYSPQLCSVSKAIKLGADAVGYTIFYGSPFEREILKELVDHLTRIKSAVDSKNTAELAQILREANHWYMKNPEFNPLG